MLEIYTKPGCVPCREAKKLLIDNQIDFTNHNLGNPEVLREFKTNHPGIYQAPAVFEDGEYIGGYQELRERYVFNIKSERQFLAE